MPSCRAGWCGRLAELGAATSVLGLSQGGLPTTFDDGIQPYGGTLSGWDRRSAGDVRAPIGGLRFGSRTLLAALTEGRKLKHGGKGSWRGEGYEGREFPYSETRTVGTWISGRAVFQREFNHPSPEASAVGESLSPLPLMPIRLRRPKGGNRPI